MTNLASRPVKEVLSATMRTLSLLSEKVEQQLDDPKDYGIPRERGPDQLSGNDFEPNIKQTSPINLITKSPYVAILAQQTFRCCSKTIALLCCVLLSARHKRKQER